MLLKVERELILLSLQDNVARIEEFDLSSAFEASITYLGDLSETLNYLSIITTIKDVVDELKHVNFVPLQEVVDIIA